VACASFGYDAATYEPTYRLKLGEPGRSLALEMAERLGLPAAMVADARARRDEKEAQAEALLETLEQKEMALRQEEERIARLRREAEAAAERARAAERELLARKRGEVEAFARELRRRADEAARETADAIEQAVARIEASRQAAAAAGAKARSEALHKVREAHEAILKDESLGMPPGEPELPAEALVVGVRVRLSELPVVGEVLALHGTDGVEVAVGGKRLRVSRQAIAAVLPAAGGAARVRGALPRAAGVATIDKAVPAEVNLIGLTVDEALPRLDKLLDDAALSDRRELRIIHGFGSGKLRKAVVALLERHPLVQAHRPGGPGEGGGGATIVELME
jgi:DNA mismatch repair protein MutS2